MVRLHYHTWMIELGLLKINLYTSTFKLDSSDPNPYLIVLRMWEACWVSIGSVAWGLLGKLFRLVKLSLSGSEVPHPTSMTVQPCRLCVRQVSEADLRWSVLFRDCSRLPPFGAYRACALKFGDNSL